MQNKFPVDNNGVLLFPLTICGGCVCSDVKRSIQRFAIAQWRIDKQQQEEHKRYFREKVIPELFDFVHNQGPGQCSNHSIRLRWYLGVKAVGTRFPALLATYPHMYDVLWTTLHSIK